MHEKGNVIRSKNSFCETAGMRSNRPKGYRDLAMKKVFKEPPEENKDKSNKFAQGKTGSKHLLWITPNPGLPRSDW